MKKYIGMAAIAASMAIAQSAMAQQEEEANTGAATGQQNKWEMSVAANIESSSSTTSATGFSSTTDQTQTFINLDVGRYFTPKLVGRVSVAMFGSDSGGSSSLGSAVGVGAKYYFGEAAESKWIPFVQGGVNLVLFESTSAGTSTSAAGMGFVGGGGVSHFLTEDVSLDFTLQGFYDYLSVDSVGSPTMENSGLRLLFGLTARY